jgi:hypothetical protein
MTHGVFSLIHMEGQIITDYRRKQDCVTMGRQRVNEVVGAYLIGKRVIQENGVAVLLLSNALKQITLDVLAV